MAGTKGPEALVVYRDTSALHSKFSAAAVADQAAHAARFPTPAPEPRVEPRPRYLGPPTPAPVKLSDLVAKSKAKKASK